MSPLEQYLGFWGPLPFLNPRKHSHLGIFAVATTGMLGHFSHSKLSCIINILFLQCDQNTGKSFVPQSRYNVPKYFHVFKENDIGNLALTLQIICMYWQNIKNQRKVRFLPSDLVHCSVLLLLWKPKILPTYYQDRAEGNEPKLYTILKVKLPWKKRPNLNLWKYIRIRMC